MNASVDVIDTVARVAPFGVQFWDRVTNSVIRDGLQVTLYLVAEPRLRVDAMPNRSGVHVLHCGPGLSAATWGDGDERYWAAPPQCRSYRCEVRDEQRRFHPVSFDVRLPFRGLFQPACDPSPPSTQDRFPTMHEAVELFSAPTRGIPGAIAVLRAELVDAADERPAAWCRLTVESNGEALGCGIADQDGKALLLFPYPEPFAQGSPPSTSPPSEVRGALMTWRIRVRAYHSRSLEGDALPDYCALVHQPEAGLLEHRSPPSPMPEVTLALGRETVLSSYGDSRLFVDHG